MKAGSPYWTEIQTFDATGKPVQGLPEEDDYFKMILPRSLLEAKPKSLAINWIDFYR